MRCKNVIISISLYFFKNCVRLKLRDSGSVCSSKGLWDINEEDITPLRHAGIVVPHILNLSAGWDLSIHFTLANYVS